MLIVADEPKLLLQEYDVPPVAVTLIEVVVHVKTVVPVLLVIPAVGAVVFCVIVTALVDVQPLLPVTVTVYVPGVVTDNPAVVLPSLHE